MASLIIHDVEEADKAALERIAAAHGRSLEEELQITIKNKVHGEGSFESKAGLGTRFRQLVERYGPFDIELPSRKDDVDREPPDFSRWPDR